MSVTKYLFIYLFSSLLLLLSCEKEKSISIVNKNLIPGNSEVVLFANIDNILSKNKSVLQSLRHKKKFNNIESQLSSAGIDLEKDIKKLIITGTSNKEQLFIAVDLSYNKEKILKKIKENDKGIKVKNIEGYDTIKTAKFSLAFINQNNILFARNNLTEYLKVIKGTNPSLQKESKLYKAIGSIENNNLLWGAIKLTTDSKSSFLRSNKFLAASLQGVNLLTLGANKEDNEPNNKLFISAHSNNTNSANTLERSLNSITAMLKGIYPPNTPESILFSSIRINKKDKNVTLSLSIDESQISKLLKKGKR